MEDLFDVELIEHADGLARVLDMSMSVADDANPHVDFPEFRSPAFLKSRASR